MRTSSRNVAFLLFDEVELLDVSGPLAVLSTAGRKWNFRPFRVCTVGARRGLVETRNQLRVEARFDVTECPPAEILVVPGGYGARRALSVPEVIAFVADTGQRVERILSIGAGALLLGKAGLLDDVQVAVHPDHVALLGELAPRARAASGAALVESGKVLSTASSAGALALSLSLVRTILGPKMSAGVAAEIGHEPAAETTAAELPIITPYDLTVPGTKPR